MRRWMNTKRMPVGVSKPLARGTRLPCRDASFRVTEFCLGKGSKRCPQCRRFGIVECFYTEVISKMFSSRIHVTKHYNRKHGKNATYG